MRFEQRGTEMKSGLFLELKEFQYDWCSEYKGKYFS